MNRVLLDTFLAVEECRSFSGAARKLYLSQSAVSGRIAQLEEELGVQLFDRDRGTRNLVVTRQGQRLISLAARYIDLDNEMSLIPAAEKVQSLTIASTDSLNNYLFKPLYEEIIKSRPKLSLTIRTNQSHENYRLLDHHETDIAFVFHQAKYSDIETTKILSEKMVVIVSPSSAINGEMVDLASLEPENEILFDWSSDITLWHDRRWPHHVIPGGRLNTSALIESFMIRPECWALCPMSVALAFEKKGSVLIKESSEKIPDRVAYLLTDRRRNDSEEVRWFKEKLIDFLHRDNVKISKIAGDA